MLKRPAALGAGLLVVLAAGACAAFTDTTIVSALWIGNSFTAKYVLPNSLKTMLRGAPDNTYIIMNNTEKIEWGQNLKYHYESTDAFQTLVNGDFDYVILQDFPYSSSAGEQQNLNEYGELFVNAAIQSGATPVMFWTWPPEANKSQLGDFVQMYESFCATRDVMIAPANVAWRHVFTQHPNYPLYNEDQLHQSQYGHYLNLCVFFSVIKQLSAEGITYRIWGEYPSAPPTLMAADTATYLQAQAWAVVDSMLGPFSTAVRHGGQPQRVSQQPASGLAPVVMLGGRCLQRGIDPTARLVLPNGAALPVAAGTRVPGFAVAGHTEP